MPPIRMNRLKLVIMSSNEFGFEKLNIILDVIIKIFAVLTVFLTVLGVFIVYSHLEDNGLQNEFISLIGSSSLIVSVAGYSMSFVVFILCILLMPYLMLLGNSMILKSKKWRMNKKLSRKAIFFQFIITISSLISYTLIFYYFDVETEEKSFLIYTILTSSVFSIIESLFLNYIYSKVSLENIKKKNILISWVVNVFCQLFFIYCVFIFVASALSLNNGKEDFSSYVFISIIYLGYSVVVAMIVFLPNDKKDSALLLSSLFLVVVFSLFNTISKFSLSRLGIGSYDAVIILKTDDLEYYYSSNDINRMKDNKTLFVNGKTSKIKVDVVLSLKEQLIISVDKENALSIPKSVVLGEELTKVSRK